MPGTDDRKLTSSSFRKLNLLLIAVIISVVAIIIGIGIFYFGENMAEDTNILSPNCYIINGKQICPSQ